MQKKEISIRTLSLCALFASLTYIATALINIRLPISVNGGLIHLGSVVLVVAASLLSPLQSGISVAVGMGLFDVTSAYVVWAPATFLIRFVQTYVLSVFLKKEKMSCTILGIVVSCLIEMGGYYLWEVILYGNWAAALSSMPGEIIHNVVGFALGIPLCGLLRRALSHKRNQ